MSSGIHPGEKIDTTLSTAELIDRETHNWFRLLHHYESDCWNIPAPTEGRVHMTTGWHITSQLRQLQEMPLLGELVVAEGTPLSAGESPVLRSAQVRYRTNALPTAYALRKGFENPANNRGWATREARSIEPLTDLETTRRVEAGLGFAFFDGRREVTRAVRSSSAGYAIVLCAEGNELDHVSAKRIEWVEGVGGVAEELDHIDDTAVHAFMQAYRESMWCTVHEPM